MPSTRSRLARTCAGIVGVLAAVSVLLTAWHYPYHTDQLSPSGRNQSSRAFYEDAFGSRIAYPAARPTTEVPASFRAVTEFVQRYHLAEKRVLEVGAGSGHLQDVVRNYVGLDIAESARRFFHQPFVQGSATDLPFRDSQFDVIWTVWTLEHVPQPEKALLEMRRVVKDGGYLYVDPAWDVPTWRSRGYDMLDYSQLGPMGKTVKMTAPLLTSLPLLALHRIPTHFVRYAIWRISGSGPTRLHYRRLSPNYERFLGPDSDAVNSLDAFEVALWFTSRGDECVNCTTGLHQIVRTWGQPLVIRVHKM